MDDSEPVDIERRDLRPDRRRQPTPMLSRRSFFGGRRSGERRGALSTEGLYVDRYPAWLFLLLMSLFALNLIDATYTLLQIANGAVELNPVAAGLLDLGP